MFSKKGAELKKLDEFFTDHTAFLEKRRELYLENQQISRSSLLSKSRNLESFLTDFDEDISQKEINILISPEKKEQELSLSNLNLMEEEEEKETSKVHVKKKKQIDPKFRKKLRQYAKIFAIPEYMFSIPSDLNPDDWYIIPRPDGIKCLLISRKGATYLIDKNGFIVKVFHCEFPGGKPKNKRGTAMIECIFDKNMNICYLLDILFWNGQSFSECSSEMRFFWLESHVQTLKQDDNSEIQFKNLPKLPCNSNGFNSAYQMNFGFTKNGLLFIAKKGPYVSGVNPYFLLWKDSGCSLYLFNNNMSETFPAFLKLTKAGQLITLDGITLGQMKQEEIEKMKIKRGDLVKVDIDESDLGDFKFIENGNIFLLKNLKVEGKSAGGKALADSFSKILFIYHIKNKPLMMTQLDDYLKRF